MPYDITNVHLAGCARANMGPVVGTDPTLSRNLLTLQKTVPSMEPDGHPSPRPLTRSGSLGGGGGGVEAHFENRGLGRLGKAFFNKRPEITVYNLR